MTPVGVTGLWPGFKSLLFPMNPLSIEVLDCFIKGIAISFVVAIFVKRLIIVHAPFVIVTRPSGSSLINIFVREESSNICFFSKVVVPVGLGDFKFLIPLEIID
jgi:hypothetical protein